MRRSSRTVVVKTTASWRMLLGGHRSLATHMSLALGNNNLLLVRSVQQRRLYNSIALEQAMRLTTPGNKFPATGVSPNMNDPEQDPVILWREYWDHEAKRPYYHNLLTNDVRWEIPKNFPSRFLDYYQRLSEEHMLGHKSIDHTQAGEIQAAAARRMREVNTDKMPSRGLKDRIKDYGPAGLLLYLIIHSLGWCFIFSLINFGVDVAKLARSFGFDIPKDKAKTKGSFLGMVALAIVINKIFSPLHLMLTVALAPRFAPSLRQLVSKWHGKGGFMK